MEEQFYSFLSLNIISNILHVICNILYAYRKIFKEKSKDHSVIILKKSLLIFKHVKQQIPPSQLLCKMHML